METIDKIGIKSALQEIQIIQIDSMISDENFRNGNDSLTKNYSYKMCVN